MAAPLSVKIRCLLLAIGTMGMLMNLLPGDAADPPAQVAAGEPGKAFIDVTEAMGLKGNNGGVAAWGDFDGDGFLDIYLTGYEAGDGYQPHAIYRNQGDGTFKEIWRTTGRFQPGRGVTAADFNEDGHLDIFVSNYRLEANNLLLNDGK